MGGWQWLMPHPWAAHLVLAWHAGVSHVSHWAPETLPLGSDQPSQEQDGEKSGYEPRAPAGSLVVLWDGTYVGSKWSFPEIPSPAQMGPHSCAASWASSLVYTSLAHISFCLEL